eukprot:gene16925-22416_t
MELFRYKVVYPGGTYVRISPHVDAEKTGEILEFGTVIEATKSLVLDGVNYIKLSNMDGWVFESKNDVEVLELLEVVRPIPNNNLKQLNDVINSDNINHLIVNDNSILSDKLEKRRLGFESMGTNNINPPEKEKLIRISRLENKFWREIRAQSNNCINFYDYMKFVNEIEDQVPKSNEVNNSSAWVPQSQREQQIRRLITLVVAVTKQCVEDKSDCEDLESALWVLVHMGSRVAKIIEYAVEAANNKYEKLSVERQRSLLHVVLEVGGRTKGHGIELSKLVDILADDIRNFLQRWIIIKIYDNDRDSSDERNNSRKNSISGESNYVNKTPTAINSSTGTTLQWIVSWIPAIPMPNCDGLIRTYSSAQPEQQNDPNSTELQIITKMQDSNGQIENVIQQPRKPQTIYEKAVS